LPVAFNSFVVVSHAKSKVVMLKVLKSLKKQIYAYCTNVKTLPVINYAERNSLFIFTPKLKTYGIIF
jgi:hypothetical protein